MAGINKEQVTIAEQFVKAMKDIADYAEKAEEAAKSQAEAMKDMTKMASAPDTRELGVGLSDVNKKVKELTEILSEMSKESDDTFKGMAKGSKGASKEMTQLAKKIAYTSVIVGGFDQGIKNVGAILKTTTNFVGGFVEGVTSIAAAVIAIPFKMFRGLIDIANGAAGGVNELATALENLRKEFGTLTGPTPKAIIGMSTELKGFSDTGLSAWRIFGNLAKRIEDFTKLAVAMGSTFDKNRKEFEQNGGALLAYQKGLGLADEDMKTFGDRSVSMGEKMGDSLKDVTKYADSMGRAFGMDAKIISRGMVKAAADVKHFGNITVKELAIAVTYSRKLGVELDKIVSVMDAFETFDSAAENAAKLSQSFGVQVDAFKMMEAQNPAEQIEMLRDQMKIAGQDASTFNRQQLKLLSSTTGLDEATARQVFSQKNQSKSLQEIQAQAGKTEKKTLTQAEAMGKLADSIERLVMSGGAQQGGFFDRFFKGFLGGVQSSREFMGIIWNINRALMRVEMIGVDLGRTFVKIFPGVKELFGGISDFFKPEHYTRLFTGFSDELKWFFKEVAEGRFSFGELMDRLNKRFFNFFSEQEGPGRKMLSGFKKIMTAVRGIVVEGVKWVATKMGEAIKTIAEFIANPTAAIANAKSTGGGFMAAILMALEPLGRALIDAAKILKPPLIEMLKNLAHAAFKFLTSPDFMSIIKPAMIPLAGAFFGPVFGRVLLTSLTQALGMSFIKGAGAIVKKAFGSKEFAAAASAGKGETSSINKIFGEGETPTKGAATNMSKSAGSLQDAAKQPIDWNNVKKFLVGFAAVIAIGLLAVGLSIIVIRKFGISREEIINGLVLVGGMALAMVPVAGAMYVLSKVKFADPKSLIMGLLAVSGGMIAIASATGLIYTTFSALNVDFNKFETFAKSLVPLSKTFAIMGAVVIEAALIGAALAFTGGSGVLAALAGFTTIAAAVGLMTVAAIAVMKGLETINFAAGLPEKVDMFMKVMGGMTDFTKVFVEVFQTLKPRFKLFQKDDPEETRRNIDAATSFVSAMIGDHKHGMIALVDRVLDAVRELGNPSDSLKAGATLFVSLMGSITSLGTALQPPPELMKTGEGSIFNITTGDAVANQVQAGRDYVTTVASSMSALIDKVKGMITQFTTGPAKFKAEDLKSIESLGGVFNLVAQGMNALKVSPDTLNALKGEKGVAPESLAKLGDFTRAQAGAMSTFMDAIKTSLPTLLNGLSNIKLPSEAQVKVISVILPIIGMGLNFLIASSNMVSNIMANASKNLAGGPSSAFAVASAFLEKIKGSLKDTFATLPEVISQVVDGIGKINLPKDPKDLLGKIGTLKGVFDVMSALVGILTNIATTGMSGADVGAKLGDRLAGIVQEIAAGIAKMTLWGVVDNKPPIQLMTDALSSDSISKLASKGAEVAKFKTAMSNVSAVTEAFAFIKDVDKSIAKDGLAPTIKAVEDMVKATQSLDGALSQLTIKPVDLRTKLGQVAKSMGLGGRAVYKVESKPITMTVNMHVTMDTAEVERIMITSKSSVIRDRINFIGENVPAAASAPLFKIKTNTTPTPLKGGED